VRARIFPLSGFFQRCFCRCLIASTAIFALVLFCLPPAHAQDATAPPADEVIVNLAAGRVIIAVVKDAIIIGTVEDPIEAGTHPPIPAELSSRRAGVMLGAVEWYSVTTQQDIARLDRDLPRLKGRMNREDPSMKAVGEQAEAKDIIAAGQGPLEALNAAAKYLHNKVELPNNEPLAELIIADYLEGYGPEVWQLNYPLQQERQRGDYWDSRVLHPRFLQFWPPEKKDARTLLEFHYPPTGSQPTLLELLQRKDPRLVKIGESDSKMYEVANQILQGQTNKLKAGETIQYLRAALGAISPPKSRQTMAAIGVDTGFEWILPPPPEPIAPRSRRKEQEREEGAPTLLKPTPGN